jgi:signal transduction histidine kinase/DNA-binding response OmpR family regulator
LNGFDTHDGEASPHATSAVLEERLAETQEQLAATSEILAILGAASAGEDQVFDAIVERARRLCRADVAQIHTVRGERFSLARSVGMSPEFLDLSLTHPIPRDRKGLVGRVSLDGTTQQIEDVLADPDYDRPEFQRLGGIRTILGAPMTVDGEVVGVLSVIRTTVDPFDERECALLSTFAIQGALALRNVELFHRLESRSAELGRKVQQLEALAEVGEAVSVSLDPDEVLATIVAHAVALSDTDGGSIMEYDEQTRLFRVRTAHGTSAEVVDALRATRIHVDETLVGRVALSRQVVQVPDLTAAELDPHLQVLFDAGWRSLVAIPLVRPDRIVGVLVVRRKRPGGFSDDTCDLLSAFASQSAVALTNARLHHQLEQKRLELAEASQHKSEFLASMSHELRTPLNAVIGFSEVLLERMFGELNERQEDYLQDILSAGRHLLALLNDVLDLSKVEAGHMELEITSFPAQDALAHALSLVRERASQHGIQLGLEADGDLGLVRADQLRFTQVLLNLLSNAVKFTPDGGRVAVAARHEGRDFVVTVSDTGVGIPASDQERIFDSFQQGNRTAASVEGTGLGLTLTKRIVGLHGGRLWLTSTPGLGSTFGFSLPQDAPADPEAQDQWDEVDAAPRGPLVVVVEDDSRSAELVGLHLRAAGLRPVVARTGEQGLAAVRSLRPAAVVLDIRLPGMSGWEVLAHLKGENATAHVPVVVVTVEPEQNRGFTLGAADWLVKPVTGERLVEAIRRALAGRVQGDTLTHTAVVVDDDPLALELVRVTLEPLGWQVHTASQGSDAVELVRAVSPAVLVVDLLMPGTDGFAVVDQVSSEPGTAHVPIVVLTGKTLTAEDRGRLEGRIAFVAEKAGLDLAVLASRLAQVAAAPPHGAGP